MSKPADRSPRIVILDSVKDRYKQFVGRHVSVCRTEAEIEKVYEEDPAEVTWISCVANLTDSLVRTVARRQAVAHRLGVRKGESLLTVQSPRPESLPALHGLFAKIVGESPRYQWLRREELIDVLVSADVERSDVFLAAAADPVTETVSLLRGDFQVVVVPFSDFEPSGDGIKPDFSKLTVTDYGRTLALGGYEASADAILYEVDPQYRKTTRRKRREAERTFGASLLRLRKQRKLRRSDFAPLTPKTIARLERNEVGKPHGKTLHVLGERLGVRPEEIESY